jgi:hypothetical protein
MNGRRCRVNESVAASVKLNDAVESARASADIKVKQDSD